MTDKIKILVIDDEPSIVDALRERLEFYGYEVVSANDGLEGLKKAESESPDIIILDIIMPKMHGFEVCKRLKEKPSTKHIPVILITGAGIEDIAKNEPALQAAACLAKPYEARKLSETIHDIVEKYLKK
ncbi:MAG: response regulator [Candidatus Omnitrophica bacterium]|nr:response regulator [Candidatus Omnitrophota bacterium]